MSDIFLSYARSDVADARRVAEALSSLGWSVWWDPELRAGEIWPDRLKDELKAARSILVLWSAASVEREWVKNEASVGFERGCLVPVTLQAAIALPGEFQHVQTDSLATWDGTPQHSAFKKLVRALAVHLGEPPRGFWTPYARQALQMKRPASIHDLSLPRTGQ